MHDCIFCKIIAKQIPASIVYEDDEMLAFKDIKPHAKVHLLLIPKQHIATLSNVTAEHAGILGKLLLLAPKLAAEHGIAVTHGADGERSGGFKTLINSGPEGGQEVYHLHLHVFGGGQP